MGNLLYITFVNFEKETYAGVVKKIEGQVRALQELNYNVYYTFLTNEGLFIKNNDEILCLRKIPKNISFKLLQSMLYKVIANWVKKNEINHCYFRYHLSDPFFILMLKRLNKLNVNILIEVPTYPYDNEFKYQSVIHKVFLKIDKIFRKNIAKYSDLAITYNDYDLVLGLPAVRIENSIYINDILYKKPSFLENEITLVGVANLNAAQGYDRIIEGMKLYYDNKGFEDPKIIFNIVGNGIEFENLKKQVFKNNLSEYVNLLGTQVGESLDLIFDNSDIGVGCFGQYRRGIEVASTLKIREYCARGIPFINAYKEQFIDESFTFCCNFENNSSPVRMDKVIDFYNSIKGNKEIGIEMREFAREYYSWETQFKKIFDTLESKN
ncbi:glycosyltransferase [Peribacillus simplex]|uniref:glycosyltransferase n=1 Tax=Peribacillus simplex TaxID=1478 RepID=UPI003D2992A9